MATAVLKSFNRDRGFAVLKPDGEAGELAAHVMGSDRTVMAAIIPGQRVRFDLKHDRHGRTFAIDVRPDRVRNRAGNP
jgi:cold shock CspA family protein